jgi:hypothetical protein
MAVAPGVGIDAGGGVFAEAAREHPSALEAWVSARRDQSDLWLLVEPLSLTEERHRYEIVNRLHERFAGTDFTLHVLNPSTFDGLDVQTPVPSDARRLGLRPTA